MSGFDCDRIVSLDPNLVNGFQCDICLLILNNPLITKCGHTFCHKCLEQSIESGAKECAKCRKPFTKKRSNQLSNEDNYVIIKPFFVFTRNLKLYELINSLKIKCDYYLNGCEELVEIGSLEDHIKRCLRRLCNTCDLSFGRSVDHNCIELLKNDRNNFKEKYEKSLNAIKEVALNLNEWKEKYEKSVNEHKNNNNCIEVMKKEKKIVEAKYEQSVVTIAELTSSNLVSLLKTDEWKYKYEEMKRKFEECSKSVVNNTQEVAIKNNDNNNSEDDTITVVKEDKLFPNIMKFKFILFGTYKIIPSEFEIRIEAIKILNVKPNDSKNRFSYHIIMPYIEMEELLYCCEPSLWAFFIKMAPISIAKIQECLNLGTNSPNGFKLDHNSKGLSHI